MSLHLLDAAVARRILSPDLPPICVWPGKTLGGVLLGYYGPGSTLEYHELAVMTGLVWAKGRLGFWVSHLYVDSEASAIGGRRLGLDKQIADFAWPRRMPPSSVTVSQHGQDILRVRAFPRYPLLPFWLGAGAVTKLRGRPLWFSSRFRAWWSLCRVEYTIPAGSPLEGLLPGRPLLAVAAKRARGLMVERMSYE